MFESLIFRMTNENYKWVYLSRGKVKHALMKNSFSNREYSVVSCCGVSPLWFRFDDWYGSGNQTEYDTLEKLPECKRCAKTIHGIYKN